MLKNLLQDIFGPIPDMAFWQAVAIVSQEAYEKCLADQARNPEDSPGCAVVFEAIAVIKDEYLFATDMQLLMKDEICD